MRRTSRVGFGEANTDPPSSALTSATASSLDPTSGESHTVRSFLVRPSRHQSFWKTSTPGQRGRAAHGMRCTPLRDMADLVDWGARRPVDQWWVGLRTVASSLAEPPPLP